MLNELLVPCFDYFLQNAGTGKSEVFSADQGRLQTIKIEELLSRSLVEAVEAIKTLHGNVGHVLYHGTDWVVSSVVQNLGICSS